MLAKAKGSKYKDMNRHQLEPYISDIFNREAEEEGGVVPRFVFEEELEKEFGLMHPEMMHFQAMIADLDDDEVEIFEEHFQDLIEAWLEGGIVEEHVEEHYTEEHSYSMIKCGPAIVGEHLKDISGKIRWKGIERHIIDTEAAGHILGRTCLYIQEKDGKAYMYDGKGSANGKSGPETWRFEKIV